MVDRLSAERRSWLMARVRSKNTSPEMAVRRIAHALGYRYRVHRRDLPGCPDLVFSSRKAVVFVHGCFWHRHPGCSKASMPKSRVSFWTEKFQRNVVRDQENLTALENAGWRVLIIWECQTRDSEAIGKRLVAFLE